MGEVRRSLIKLASTLLILLSLRSLALDGLLPSFSRSDNPASHQESLLVRSLTFLHLPVLNALLLVLPATLR